MGVVAAQGLSISVPTFFCVVVVRDIEEGVEAAGMEVVLVVVAFDVVVVWTVSQAPFLSASRQQLPPIMVLGALHAFCDPRQPHNRMTATRM